VPAVDGLEELAEVDVTSERGSGLFDTLQGLSSILEIERKKEKNAVLAT
jgi:hypothetical protein